MRTNLSSFSFYLAKPDPHTNADKCIDADSKYFIRGKKRNTATGFDI